MGRLSIDAKLANARIGRQAVEEASLRKGVSPDHEFGYQIRKTMYEWALDVAHWLDEEMDSRQLRNYYEGNTTLVELVRGALAREKL